ncbi:MAG: DUF4105 domain-containing protein [Bacteroidaceae bacterium]|nr:DUF4105 domain-containing protein [Bacteroidaceae bacterium]
MKLKYGLWLLLLLCELNIFAQTRSLTLPTDTADTWQVSLITCGPGVEVYNQFGHTAIRMKNVSRNIDLIYNYGIFSFNTPNFVLRFTLGKTDYLLGIQAYQDFVDWYAYCNRDVREQVLNLSIEEKNTLIGLLNENYKPQNRTYRYNFFYDNCATRPRDLIEKCLQSKLQYADDMTTTSTGQSFRSIVHEFTANNSWSQFGIDLCLGSEADKPISRRAMMFIPLYLEKYFDKATILPHERNNNSSREKNKNLVGEKSNGTYPLITESKQLVTIPEADKVQKDTPFTPFRCATFMFIVTTVLTIYEIRSRKSMWGFDLILFTAAGIAGCMLAFLATFSEHPTVSPNYLLFLFQPLHLLLLPWFIKKVKKMQRSSYLVVLTIELLLFIVLWAIIPQKFPLAVLPLALCLLVRSASNWLLSQPYKA